MSAKDSDSLKFLSPRRLETLEAVAEAILGVPRPELGDDFKFNVDEYVVWLPSHLQKDLKLLFSVLGSPLISLFFVGRLSRFSKLSVTRRRSYLKKWSLSRIPLLRTGYMALKSLCGWGYYSQESVHAELDYPGPTIGREDETPTLMYGKEKWRPPSNMETRGDLA